MLEFSLIFASERIFFNFVNTHYTANWYFVNNKILTNNKYTISKCTLYIYHSIEETIYYYFTGLPIIFLDRRDDNNYIGNRY